MKQSYGEKMPGGLWNMPAAERNKEAILAALNECVPSTGKVLEIASGTGQHIVHFAKALGDLDWLPSDPNPDFRVSIQTRIGNEKLGNVASPLDLDVMSSPWPVAQADMVLCSNMLHVAPWEAAKALIKGTEEILTDVGVLFLYGPYRRDGTHTAPSNEAFDAQLRQKNSDWGVRDLESLEKLGQSVGLSLDEVVEMPANNFSLIFRRLSGIKR
jgi:SAM-dependent methyltransferase